MTPQAVLGGVVNLMRFSKVHRSWTTADISASSFRLLSGEPTAT